MLWLVVLMCSVREMLPLCRIGNVFTFWIHSPPGLASGLASGF